MTSFAEVCAALSVALSGSLRRDLVGDAARAADLAAALARLREGMRSNIWRTEAQAIDFARAVHKYDRRTRKAGFHVLNDWDGIADRVNADTIPMDVLNYLIDRRGHEPADPVAIAILLDYYFLHLLALLSVRIWDEGDADANLDAVDRLLNYLQGPEGSGHKFSADAETLILIATSHYELHERGYGSLLETTRTLSGSHRLKIALGHAASMGSHLRFGFEATYGRDTVNMRDDNVADYPWLCFAIATLMRGYVERDRLVGSGVERARLVEALLNGLSADPRAFVGRAPASLAGSEDERAGFRDAFQSVRTELLAEFEGLRPTGHEYSPLCFFFNFSHNVVKGVAIDALLQRKPATLTFNDLLTGVPRDQTTSEGKVQLAETLMGYARNNPHRIRGRLKPIIVYDVQSGREAFAVALRKLKD